MSDWRGEHNEKQTDTFNEEHAIADKRACSLINVAEDEVDASAFQIRIPYEDLDYLQCTTVDILLLLASGIRPKDVVPIISKRYPDLEDFSIDTVYRAKRKHPKEFHRMLSFYRQIFLNQQCQGLEQQIIAKVADAIPEIEIESMADALKATQMLKMMTEIRKNKEEDGNYKGITKEAYSALEKKMKALTGGGE